jgi:hypothetical protein
LILGRGNWLFPCPQCPHRACCPPSLLLNKYRGLFSRDKSVGHEPITPLRLVLRSRIRGVLPSRFQVNAAGSLETMVKVYETPQCHFRADSILHSLCGWNFKSLNTLPRGLNTWVSRLALAGTACSNPALGMDVSLLRSVVNCQADLTASGRSLVESYLTECGVPECDREASTMRTPWPTTRGSRTLKNEISTGPNNKINGEK